MIARAFGVPMAALFLPPEDDLVDYRYVTIVGEDEENDIADMRFLQGAAMSEPPVDEPSPTRAYEERYVRTVSKYFDTRVAEAVARRVKERILEEELASACARHNETRGRSPRSRTRLTASWQTTGLAGLSPGDARGKRKRP
jgi:hypothetical protein